MTRGSVSDSWEDMFANNGAGEDGGRFGVGAPRPELSLGRVRSAAPIGYTSEKWGAR